MPGRPAVSQRPSPLSLCAALVAAAAAAAAAIEATRPDAPDCGIWLGPSPIKEQEDHGWGHSVFTGRFIAQGTAVFSGGVLDDATKTKVSGDLFVPVYDWETMDAGGSGADDYEYSADGGGGDDEAETPQEKESMLYQETWNGDDYPAVVLESHESMRVYMPGLANLCPCAADGYNLAQAPGVTYRDWRSRARELTAHDASPPPPQAGSFSYLSNAAFVASRDIQAGEELVVQCEGDTDGFSPKDYPPVAFQPKEAGGYAVCLDDKVEERRADHTPNVAAASGGQRGLFAKRRLEQDEVLTSSPMVPVHREELTEETPADRAKYQEWQRQRAAFPGSRGGDAPPPRRQALLLNYMFGHPESSLLWLPQAPLVLAANHAPHGGRRRLAPNAEFRWHHDAYTDAQAAGKPLTRRQQFHHAELLGMSPAEFVHKNGMGLMIDLVATRPIAEGGEVVVDYGAEWDAAMEAHTGAWAAAVAAVEKEHAADKEQRKQRRQREREGRKLYENSDTPHDSAHHKHRQRDTENAMTAVPLSSYVTADDYNRLHRLDDIRTVSEQRRKPYPSNLETACHFEMDWLDDEIETDLHAEQVAYDSWYHQDDHFDSSCLLPCMITERRDYVPGEENKAGEDDYDYSHDAATVEPDPAGSVSDNGGSATPRRYTAKLMDTHPENVSINFECHLFVRFEYIYLDVPREGIVFVNKPHSTDHWIEHSFRHEIGLPEEMVPENWRDRAEPRERRGKAGGMRGSRPDRRAPKAEAGKQPLAKKKALTKEEEEEEVEYRVSTKRWNDVETRRERLESTEVKRLTDLWPGEEI